MGRLSRDQIKALKKKQGTKSTLSALILESGERQGLIPGRDMSIPPGGIGAAVGLGPGVPTADPTVKRFGRGYGGVAGRGIMTPGG